MKQFLYLVAVVATVALSAAAAANGGTRPDDRPNHGTGAAVLDSPGIAVRPDDRAWRGVGPAPAITPISSPSVQTDGFDWADAGIGAAAAFGLGLLMLGASVFVLRRVRVAALSS